ncbi:MAG: inosine/xanthosine triphosphatase [Candidatus Aenigmarchaeota archaeon]|nr:inosine/xanthosine triphosphatase [Candidatus Aenigmarchaeota archaeon]
MIINLGSKNEVKISAVKELVKDYPFLKDAKVLAVQTLSKVSDQPKSLEETILGAMNRARNIFINCDYSIGIEDGLMAVPSTKTGYMNVCVCVIYDGRNYHMGLSPAFEYPPKVTRLVFKESLEIDDAVHKAGITKNPDIGSHEGMIGLLTNGRLVRKDYTKQAIMMALIQLENRELY